MKSSVARHQAILLFFYSSLVPQKATPSNVAEVPPPQPNQPTVLGPDVVSLRYGQTNRHPITLLSFLQEALGQQGPIRPRNQLGVLFCPHLTFWREQIKSWSFP